MGRSLGHGKSQCCIYTAKISGMFSSVFHGDTHDPQQYLNGLLFHIHFLSENNCVST